MSVPEKESSEETQQAVITTESEEERIARILNQTDQQKFQSFIKMMRRNATLKQAKITHK